MSRYTDAYGPNVEQILVQASRVIRGTIPRQVRNQLMAAVRDGVLGRLPKDGLKPEVFFHPDHKHGAIERQRREAEYAIGCVASVMHVPTVEERIASIPRNHAPATERLPSGNGQMVGQGQWQDDGQAQQMTNKINVFKEQNRGE